MNITPMGHVWHSDARHPKHVIGFTCEMATDWDAYLGHLQIYRRGEMAARPDLPDRMWIADGASRAGKALKALPDTFVAAEYFVVSQRVAEVMERFDLGGSALLPVALSKKGNTDPFCGSYYIVHLTEQKAAFDPDNSNNFDKPRYEDDTYLGSVSRTRNKDDDIVCNASAVVGVDLWTDPLLLTSLMLSDPLYQALAGEELLNNANTLRCVVSAPY
ncbi:imm11 family protein [Gymnodinialimonas ulvae]|uniref:imm11 family protein n=1 Tax=Gymnodinialimonas ulvae TaxID=3126504 RepID=UPI0030B0B66C